MNAALPYLPVVLAVLFLNLADVYFLQSEQAPPLHRSPSLWLYLIGHTLVALFAANLLYGKGGLHPADWPVVTAVAALAGFSVLQSLTLKFGDKGLDARELFDSWKRRVLQDLSKANASKKHAQIAKTARALATKAKETPNLLEPAIHQLAPSVQLDPVKVIDGLKKTGQDPNLMMALWIANADLDFAQDLLTS